MAEEDEFPEGSDFREKLEETLAKNKALELRVALMDAGVDVSTPMGKMFQEAVATRPEFVVDDLKEEWEALPANTPGTPPAQTATDSNEPGKPAPSIPGASAQALESLGMSEQVGDVGKPPGEQTQLTAPEAARLARQESKDAGEDPAMQSAAFFGTMLSRATQNDPTAVWTQESWNEKLKDVGELV